MKKAFTLIELMVVVAIVALLASIAIPRYFKFHAKAKQVEAAMILSSLHTAQQIYWSENGRYSTNLNGPGGIGWKPAGYNGSGEKANFYYTYGFYFPGAIEGVHFFIGKLKTPPRKLGDCFAKKSKFVARAAGDLMGDDKCDLWSVDETRSIKHDQNGI